MKTFFLAALCLLATASSSFAYTSMGTCYAYTACFNRFGVPVGQISCSVTANASARMACSWFVSAGNAVQCTGMAVDMWGNYGWMTISDSCARFW